MNLTSGLSRRYRQAFLLDEDGLRRFHGLLKKAANDLAFPTDVVFHIEREDDRYYETADIEEVLADPNIPGKRVTLVRIELRPQEPQNQEDSQHSDWMVMVVYSLRERDRPFPDPDEVLIRIATHDKNWALLLADDLEPQVQRTFKAKRTPRWLIGLLLIPFLFLLLRGVVCDTSKRGGLSPEFIVITLAIGVMLMVLLWMSFRLHSVPQWFVKAFGPEAAFLWGEEAQSYPSREQTRRNIQWGVIIAFLASLVAGIVVALATFGGSN